MGDKDDYVLVKSPESPEGWAMLAIAAYCADKKIALSQMVDIKRYIEASIRGAVRAAMQERGQ